MQRPARYKILGYMNNVPVSTVFKNLKSAIRYAEQHVSKPIFFDLVENRYIEIKH